MINIDDIPETPSEVLGWPPSTDSPLEYDLVMQHPQLDIEGEDTVFLKGLIQDIMLDAVKIPAKPTEPAVVRIAREYATFSIFTDTVDVFDNSFLRQIASDMAYSPVLTALFIRAYRNEIKNYTARINKKRKHSKKNKRK